MKEKIIAYLSGPRPYREGIALYEEYGLNLMLKATFRRNAETDLLRATLMEELRKLAGISETAFRTMQRKAVDSPHISSASIVVEEIKAEKTAVNVPVTPVVGIRAVNVDISGKITADSGRIGPFSIDSGMLSSKTLYEGTDSHVGFNLSAGQIEFYNERTFARVKIGGNTKFVTIEGISYDAGIDIQSPNAMIGMHIKTLSIPLFVEGGNIFLHPNNDSYVSLHGIVGNWRNISVSTSLNNNDDNVMFINTGNIEVTLPPDVPGHTIYFKRMSGGVRLTGGRILPAPGGKEMSSIDLDYASGFVKCMGNYWVMFYCG